MRVVDIDIDTDIDMNQCRYRYIRMCVHVYMYIYTHIHTVIICMQAGRQAGRRRQAAGQGQAGKSLCFASIQEAKLVQMSLLSACFVCTNG